MKRKIFNVLFALLLVISLSLVTAVPAAAQTDRLVPSPYSTIQAAIDAADPGDTIIVSDGTYNESISVTTADLTLRSENGRDSTIIENVGNVTSPEVAQCGFLIRGPANNFTLGGAANQGFTFSGGTSLRLVQLNNSPSGVKISYNEIDTTGDATTGINIGAAGATGLTVSNNIFVADEGEYQDWSLIGPDTTNPVLDVTVTDNEFTGSGTPDKYGAAICLGTVGVSSLEASTFNGNTISAFDRGIIISAGSSDLDVSGNTISGCDKGVQFRADTHAEMENNTFADNTYNIYHAAEIVTGGSSFYGDIQDAIDAASSGETVLVYDGTYNEQVFISKASLTVESVSGNATTIIDGTGVTDAGPTGHSSLVWLQKDGISFKGFTVQNYQNGWENGGLVRIHGWDGTNWAEGISGCLVTENKIIGATVTPSADNIIIGYGADGNTVSNNEITNSYGDGIIISSGPDCDDNQITGNTITNSATYGVSLCTDSMGNQRNFPGTVISNNTISGGTHGVGVIYASGNATSHIVIQNNTISGVTTGEAEGIEVYYGGYVDMFRNIVQGNGTGIQVKFSADIVANYNSITGNTGISTGFEAADNAADVDATKNWWGDAAGPSIWTNPYYNWTNGDSVSDYVDYIPWMLHNELVADWNLWSVPIAPAADCDTVNEALNLWGADSSKKLIAYYFDSSASPQAWAEATSLRPLEAYYVKMSEAGIIDVCFSTDATFPPQRAMYRGWNLVGPAHLGGQSVEEGPPSGQYGKRVDTALISAYYATGVAEDLWGYSDVISPSLNGIYWEYIRGQNAGFRLFYPTKGYWVYMVNQGGMNGSTETPVMEISGQP